MVVCKYLLVEFVVRGPKTTRSIDIGPSRWMDIKKGKTTVTKFMPPPYTPENNELLHSLVKADADALKCWPQYRIKIKGQASK